MDLSSFPRSESSSDANNRSVPLPHTAVNIEDAFWASRLRTLREYTLFHIYEQFRLHEYFEFYRRPWKGDSRPIPYVFWESDFSKWLEAASYSLATHPNPELERLVDEVIDYIGSFQQPDGYLNLWFTAVEPL